ncbi:MAG TPA: hypothetical protein VHB79_21825 [Polyangiaceae bacterium]|nr:hypothetical protein [Polyangiaceae bacterium]
MRKKAARLPRSIASNAESTAQAGVLILVELGGQWPSIELAETAPRRVLSQLEGETPAQFATRAASLLDSLFGRGVPLGKAVLACNERLDVPAEAARRKLCGLALGAMAKQKSGQVSLSASERSSARLRQGLTTLSQSLFDEWRTAGLEVTVLVGPERAPAQHPRMFAHTARVA